jgi:hypothetical protein
MADLAGIMRRLADEIEKEERGDESKATQDRITKLEERLAAAKKREPAAVDDALEEITDEELELIRAHRASLVAPTVTPPPVDPPVDPPAAKTRPGRKKGQAYQWTVDEKGKVQRTDIAHIYSGEDEPDHVEILEEVDDAAA